jgi:acyl carrier protein
MRKLTKKECDKIKEIIANQTQCDESEITPKSHVMHDLGGDSLDAIELIMCLEEHFEIQITDTEAEKAMTVEQIEKLVERKLNDPAGTHPVDTVA